jgi:hypothetical protein
MYNSELENIYFSTYTTVDTVIQLSGTQISPTTQAELKLIQTYKTTKEP